MGTYSVPAEEGTASSFLTEQRRGYHIWVCELKTTAEMSDSLLDAVAFQVKSMGLHQESDQGGSQESKASNTAAIVWATTTTIAILATVY